MDENKMANVGWVDGTTDEAQAPANVPVPQQQDIVEEKKPNIFKRGFGWVKKHGKTIAKGAGLVLAGAVAGVVVGALASKRDEENGYETSDDNYGGNDYDWPPESDKTETETEDFDFGTDEDEEIS